MWLLLNACNQWLRTHLAWSNSRRSWQERIGTFLWLLVAAALLWWGGKMSLAQQVAVWGTLIVVLAVMLRRGWIKLFGPVLFYDMIRISRRSRYTLFRFGYVGALLLILIWAWYIWEESNRYRYQSVSGGASLQMNAEFAESQFFTFMIIQLVLTVILTPAYVAGAIAEEKDRKTLEYLLATDLRNREIVLSKLVARLANLLLIVLAGLPVLSFLQFFGGIDPDLLVAAFAATGLIMASLAGVSILFSVHARKPRDAIVLTYLAVLAYHGIASLFLFLRLSWVVNISVGLLAGTLAAVGAYVLPPGSFGIEVTNAAVTYLLTSDLSWLTSFGDAINAGNLFVALFDLTQAISTNQTLADTLPDLLRNFAIFHGLVAVITATWAVVRLRAIGLKEAAESRARLPLASRLFGRPQVGDQPMLWKEVFAEPGIRFNWLGRLCIGLLVGLSFLPVVFIVYGVLDRSQSWRGAWEELSMSMNFYVRIVGTLVACLTLLAVAVRAAGCLANERDRQTFDGLLTTPLDSHTILLAKWVGSIASVRWAWAWLGMIWLLGVIFGGLQPVAVLLVIAAWLVYAGCFACIGQWFSLVCRTTLRATIWTLITTVFLGGGHWVLSGMCCFMPLGIMGGNNKEAEYLAKFQFGQTPPLVMGLMAFHGDEFKRNRDWEEMMEFVGFSALGLGTWTVAALGLAALINHRFSELTLRQPFRRPERSSTLRLPTITGVDDAPLPAVAPVANAVLIEEDGPQSSAWHKATETRPPPEMTDGV